MQTLNTYQLNLLEDLKKERIGLKSIALNSDTSALTSIANDYNYKNIFSRQLEALSNKGDVLVAFSTSGNSKNIIEVLKKLEIKNFFLLEFFGNNEVKQKNIATEN